jgi:methylenetetrahydrofolate reductase (NADPH)
MSPDTGPLHAEPMSAAPFGLNDAHFPARAPQRLEVSFEFSPPKTEAAERTLWETVTRLTPLRPTFFSVTYGAGGSTRQRTHETVVRLKKETGIDPAAHLTCVAATRGEIDDVARAYWDAGIRHIVALRGDPPGGIGGKYTPHPGGYANAAELIAGLKKIGAFQISAAGYPEKHPDSANNEADLDNLKRKVDAGAERCITQFFFEAEDFLRFRDRAATVGVNVPIVPGIMPVSNFQGIQKMAGGCGSKVPSWLAHLFDGLDEDAETRRMIAATVAGDLCRRLQSEGVEQFHFYTLNRADLTFAICHLLGVRPQRSPS